MRGVLDQKKAATWRVRRLWFPQHNRQDLGSFGQRFDACRPKSRNHYGEHGNCAEPTVTLVSLHKEAFVAKASSEIHWCIDNVTKKQVVKLANYEFRSF